MSALAVVGGCSSTLPYGAQGSLSSGLYSPVVMPQTAINFDLRSMPPPTKRTAVAVYDFPDMTGQYKEQETFQSLSRAVTQGGAAMLIKALQDAGERSWFTVLDRASLDNLLKERQILTEMRKVYRGEQTPEASVLPPLDSASILLEGGITGYDTNTLTGGAGANFLGIGGDVKWRQDTITVTLRAVSAKTSEVLASVTVNKVIASVGVGASAFRYVQLDRLLQAEAGMTQNEPKQIAVQGAIEKAVAALIIEGAQLKVWSFKDKAAGDQLIEQYLPEKYGYGVTAGARSPLGPVTENAAAVVRTKPVPVSDRTSSLPQATVQTFPAPAGGSPSGQMAAPRAVLPPPQGADGEALQ